MKRHFLCSFLLVTFAKIKIIKRKISRKRTRTQQRQSGTAASNPKLTSVGDRAARRIHVTEQNVGSQS